MNYITDILYWISTGLLVPVIVLLILLFCRALLLIGTFFGQYLAVRKTEALLKGEFDALSQDNLATLADRLPKSDKSLVVRYIRLMMLHRDSEAHLQKLLSDFDLAAAADRCAHVFMLIGCRIYLFKPLGLCDKVHAQPFGRHI